MVTTLLCAVVVVLGEGSATAAGAASASPPPRLSLAAAAAGWRPVEARISGGFSYAPLADLGSASVPKDPMALARAAARIASAASTQPSAVSLADLGALNLLQGQVEEAVGNLEKARVASSKDEAPLLSDLAAAYLTRAESGGSVRDLVRALETLERAVAAATPSLPEALFNRALALEELGLRRAAATTWTEYLTLNDGSGWANEARSRREKLAFLPEPDLWAEQRPRLDEAIAGGNPDAVAAVVSRGPGFARRDALEILLPGWAKAKVGNRTREAKERLAAARAIGSALVRVQGDEFVRDVVAEIEGAGSGPAATARMTALLSGHLALDEGRSLLAESRLEAGVAKLWRAEKYLTSARSPLVLRARCMLSRAAYVQAKFEDGLALAERVRKAAAGLPYPALRAETARWVGLMRSVLGRPAEAIEAYNAALADLETAGSRDDVAAVKSLLAENLAALGADEEAWALRVEALRVAESFRGTGGTYNIAFEAADAAVAEGHPRAALPLLDAAVTAAETSGNQIALFEILIERSTARDRVGREADAVADRARARTVALSLNDDSLKLRLEAESLLVEGELQATREPSVAIGLLSRAESSLEAMGRRYLLPRVYRGLARAYTEAGQIRESETSLGKAIAEGEARSGWAPAVAATRRDPHREALAEMVRLQFVGLAQPASALDYAEQVRSWRLRGVRASSRGEGILPGRWGDSATSCGPRAVDTRGGARIEYFVLGDRILAWLVTADGLSSAEALVDESRVRELVADVVAGAEQGPRQGDLDAKLERIYDLLVRPLRHLIPRQGPLRFVPDSALEAVPFGALRERETGRYLIEDHEVAVTSSVGCAAENEPRPSRLDSGTLVVGDPAFDHGTFPWLSPLSGAEREARAVSELHPGSRLLLREAATKDRFLRGAAASTVVHFAGHVFGNQDRPELSTLVFAPDESARPDAGVLYARDLLARDLNGLELVVLSACGTGLGPHHGPVGLGGLAWSFLAAGVGQVVTAVWRVEDRTTSEFMVDFHRRLRAEPDAAVALRQVQLDWIRHPDRNRHDPALWGGFTVVVSQQTRPRPATMAATQP